MNKTNEDKTFTFVRSLESVMGSRGWVANQCSSCNRLFYSKDSDKSECGWRKCSTFSLGESKTVLNRKQISLNDLLNKMRALFVGIGYKNHDSIRMTAGMNTDLVSAGVQIFSDALLSGGSTDQKGIKFFVAQPCVRLSSLKSQEDSISPDMSTSFVNICTESLGVSIDDHIKSVDDWISVLSNSGLHARKMNLIVKDREEDWGAGKFLMHQIFFVYDSVEIGDANFTFALPNCENLSMSDIGFGLERVCWVINGLSEYSHTFSNLESSSDYQLQDTCRTIALLLLSKVNPSSRGAGGRLRWLIKRAMLKGDTDSVVRLVYFYLNFWKGFSENELDYDSMSSILMPECDWLLIRDVCLEFGISPKPGLSLIELVNILVYNRGIDPKLVKKLISQKRNEKK